MSTKIHDQPAVDEPLLVGDEVAALLRFHKRTVNRLANQKINPLPSVLLPGTSSRRFRRADVLAWVARGEQGGLADV